MKRIGMMIVLIAGIAAPLFAQKGWELDKVHSRIEFTVKHMVISEVTGNFKDFSITLNSSKDDFSDAAVEATIKTASVNTDNDYRDKDLRSDNFFGADRYPEITFKSTSFKNVGGNKFQIIGNLTMRDVTKQVTFDGEYLGTVTTQGVTHAGWKVTITVNRFDYGLKWNKTIETGGLIVGQDVNVTMTLEFKK